MILLAFEFFDNTITHRDEHDRACRLRDTLLKIGGLSDDLRFDSRPNGKPYIIDSPVTYSITHTDGCIACAVSVNECNVDALPLPAYITEPGIYKLDCNFPCDVGIDVELVDRERSGDRIDAVAKRFFTENERARLYSSQDKSLEFYKLWTEKESFVKCTGTGMSGIAGSDTMKLSEGFTAVEFVAKYNNTEFAGTLCIKSI